MEEGDVTQNMAIDAKVSEGVGMQACTTVNCLLLTYP